MSGGLPSMVSQSRTWLKRLSSSSSSSMFYIIPQLPWWLRRLSVCLQCGRPGFNPWVWKIFWRRKWQPTPVFLPGKSHGWRNLVGYSPWGRKELDMTERTHSLTHSLILSHRSYMLLSFSFFLSFSLLFWLSGFHYPIFQITYSFFSVI